MTTESTFRFDPSGDDDAARAGGPGSTPDASSPAASPAEQGGHADDDRTGGGLSQETLDAVSRQVRDIAEVPAIEVITTSAVHLMSAAAVKCGLAEGPDAEELKDLDEARRLITALAGFVTAAAPEIGSQHAAPLRDGLRTLQLAFREASPYPDKPGQGPGEKFTGPVFA